jgi:hypothetical protein
MKVKFRFRLKEITKLGFQVDRVEDKDQGSS